MQLQLNQSGQMPVLADDENPPFEIDNPNGSSRVVVVCDHARNMVPRVLDDLGVDASVLAQHVAYDIGCEGLARRLARLLDAPLVLSRFSRLVIDLNRHLTDPTSILEISDGIVIPGNRRLSREQAMRRAEEIFLPYHNAVSAQLEHVRVTRGLPVLITVHSFVPQMNGVDRPWHVGVLWNKDDRISRPLLESLTAEADLCVGDNEPYNAHDLAGYTMETQAEARGYPHALLEIRQDLIATEADGLVWAERLARHLQPILSHKEFYEVNRLS